MKFIDNLFHRTPAPQPAPKPAPKPDVTAENHFQVQDGVLRQSADSLSEYHYNKSVMSDANKLFEGIQSTEALKKKDGSKADFDARPGHVVLANEGFEWHPDTKALFQETPGKKVEGDGESLKILYSGNDIYGSKNNLGIWNTTTGEFTYRRDVPDSSGSPVVYEETEELLETGKGTFKISADGKVETPSAQSLAEAKTVAPQREMASRAEELIGSWKVWSEKSQGLDQTDADISKQAGTVVAPELGRSQLGIAESDPLLSIQATGGEYHDELYTHHSYDIEQSGGRIRVGASNSFNDYSGWEYKTELSATKTDSELNLTLRSEQGTVENVQWNTQDGTVKYQKLGTDQSEGY